MFLVDVIGHPSAQARTSRTTKRTSDSDATDEKGAAAAKRGKPAKR